MAQDSQAGKILGTQTRPTGLSLEEILGHRGSPLCLCPGLTPSVRLVIGKTGLPEALCTMLCEDSAASQACMPQWTPQTTMKGSGGQGGAGSYFNKIHR